MCLSLRGTCTRALQSIDTSMKLCCACQQVQCCCCLIVTLLSCPCSGGAWNHAFFFKQLTPGGTPQADYNSAASDAFKTAINSAFGNFTAFQTRFTTAATGIFGSGFAWLIVTESGALNITTTPNQNNPLQTALANSTKTTVGIPVLGIDVWEHAYYLKHQNLRPDYITAFYSVINWGQISQNHGYAAAGVIPATAASPLLTATA